MLESGLNVLCPLIRQGCPRKGYEWLQRLRAWVFVVEKEEPNFS